MVQTDLKSDAFCDYNQAAAQMYWILDPVQNRLQYNIGETGVPTGVGLHTPGEVIKVDSYLKDIGNYLTGCVPPAPPMPSKLGNSSDASIEGEGAQLPIQGAAPGIGKKIVPNPQFNNQKVLVEQQFKENFSEMEQKMNSKFGGSELMTADGKTAANVVNSNTFLIPDAGQNVKRSANDLSSVDWQAGFAGNPGNLYSEPQNLTYVIERMALERGGLDANQLLKQSWNLATPSNPKGPLGLNGNYQTPTALKVRQPYPMNVQFGLAYNQTPSEHYNATDVASVAISGPAFDQDLKLPFNYDAVYSNGGCNPVSEFKIDEICDN